MLRRSRHRPAGGLARPQERGGGRGGSSRSDRARAAARVALPSRALAGRLRHARVHPVPHRLPRPLAPRAAVRGRARGRGAAALAAGGRGRANARARHRVVAARALPRLDRPLGLVERRRACGGDRPARVLRPLRDPRPLDRAPAVGGVAGADPLRRARGDGARLRRRRLLPVRDEDHLPEPEAEPEQHLRGDLPRQLRLLRPVDLREIPRRRDDRDGRAARPRRAVSARGPRGARVHGGGVARAADLVLPVELRRAARVRLRADRGGLALEVALRARGRPRGRSWRSPWRSRG